MDEENSFRDSIATVDSEGKRVWLFPKKPSGSLYNKRKLVSYLLLILLFSGPYISINGNPLLMLNILERKFVFFGQVFWPQDLHIFALGMVTMVLFVALFTVVYGRLFCGWVCPQTIFMEMVFRRIEYAIDGDWKQQQYLKKAPWSISKVIKRVSKHSIFWIISFLIANTFLAYIIGYKELLRIVNESPKEHIGGLTSIVIFTTIFYLVFSRFREQVCIAVCPYGRLQSVLLDRNSLVVAYDHLRGESRGLFKKGEDRKTAEKGDCIDCHQCVNVCPTGIDIRNGTQLECTNCTACIDACDFIMEKTNMPKGLIRFASTNGIEKKIPFGLTNKTKAYSLILVLLVGILVSMLATRSDFEATVLRTRGTLFQRLENGSYSNIYDISLVNKTNDSIPVSLKILGEVGTLKVIGKPPTLAPQSESKGKFLILIDEEDISQRKIEFEVGIYGNNQLIQRANTTFISPGI